MGHMGIGHEKVIVADHRFPVFFRCGAVYGRAFTDNIVIADEQRCFFAFVPDVLGRRADGRKRADLVPLADRGPALDQNMGGYFRVPADFDMPSASSAFGWTIAVE